MTSSMCRTFWRPMYSTRKGVLHFHGKWGCERFPCLEGSSTAVFGFSAGKGISSQTQARTEHSKRLTSQLETRIKTSGPLPVADYMKEVLTNPTAGYYQQRLIFGEAGDFVTSPEISQMFGELISAWFLNEWQKIGSPKPLQIIELGPGKGTLMRDIIKILAHFGEQSFSVHLVEVSKRLSEVQSKTLEVTLHDVHKDALYHQMGCTYSGIPVFWYSDIQDIPRQFSFVVANEFFDALPIHKFQKTKEGWREILIDIDPEAPGRFRYVLSRSATPVSILIKKNEKREHLEISPKTAVIVQHIASRIQEDGGIVLLADYGDDGRATDTFRAFRDHALHDPLVEPGTADLTADVDFSLIRNEAEPKLATYGPVTQGEFFERLGIRYRLQVLLDRCDPEQREKVEDCYHMLVDKDKMGERFKFFAMFPAVLKEFHSRFPLAGFV